MLNPMDTCPMDRAILLDVGLPWLVVGCYNELEQEFVYAMLQCDGNDECTDTWFETEYEKIPLGWMEIPNKP